MNQNNLKILAQEWFEKGSHDLDEARLSLKGGDWTRHYLLSLSAGGGEIPKRIFGRQRDKCGKNEKDANPRPHQVMERMP